MNRQEIVQLLPELKIFLDTFRRFSLLLIIITFTGYSSAAWLWLNSQTSFAVLSASLSFILFYFAKRQLINLSCYYLKQDPRYDQTIHFIQKNLLKKSGQDLIVQLHKALQVIQKNSP